MCVWTPSHTNSFGNHGCRQSERGEDMKKVEQRQVLLSPKFGVCFPRGNFAGVSLVWGCRNCPEQKMEVPTRPCWTRFVNLMKCENLHSDQIRCAVCLDRPPEVRFSCGHLVCCLQCGSQMNHCPFCREVVRNTFGQLLPFEPESEDESFEHGRHPPLYNRMKFRMVLVAFSIVWSATGVYLVTQAYNGNGLDTVLSGLANFSLEEKEHRTHNDESIWAVEASALVTLPWMCLLGWCVLSSVLAGEPHEDADQTTISGARKRARQNWNRRG